MKNVAIFVVLGIGGAYLGAWGGDHANEWWSFPTVLIGVVTVVGAVIGVVSCMADQGRGI